MNYKPLILIFIAINIAFVAWLALRQPAKTEKQDMSLVVEELVSTKTLENARYDLSDQADKLGR